MPGRGGRQGGGRGRPGGRGGHGGGHGRQGRDDGGHGGGRPQRGGRGPEAFKRAHLERRESERGGDRDEPLKRTRSGLTGVRRVDREDRGPGGSGDRQRPDGERGPRPGSDDRRRSDGPPRERWRADARRRHGGRAEPAKAVLWTPGRDARYVRAEAGMKLAAFLAHEHPRLSVRAARKLLDQGACRVNGRIETFGSRELKVGDVVEFFLPEDREHHFDPRRVLRDEGGVLAYDKPAWLPVTPTEGPKSWSLVDILKQDLGGTIIPVHRLDADTSGVVLFARDEKSARALEDAFREHRVKKTYLAIVRGHPRESGERRSYLVKVTSGKGFERWQSGRGPDAREAVTTWSVRERIGTYASLVEVVPMTGRYHQIRIHFSEMGHPIYGDRIYGDRQDPVHVGRHLLHAARVELEDPAGGEPLVLDAPIPREFAQADQALRRLKG